MDGCEFSSFVLVAWGLLPENKRAAARRLRYTVLFLQSEFSQIDAREKLPTFLPDCYKFVCWSGFNLKKQNKTKNPLV